MTGAQNRGCLSTSNSPKDVLSRVSWRSWFGLCAASFFLAEECGVAMPFVNTYLVECGWRYDTVGVAVSVAGMVSLLVNLPGGFLIDYSRRHRFLTAIASVLVGTCYGLLPFTCDNRITVFLLLALAAVGKSLFGPLTNALALGLVGQSKLNRAVGLTEGWNHAGNIAAATVAIALVNSLPLAAVFFSIALVSLLAAASAFLIRSNELDECQATGLSRRSGDPPARFLDLLRDRRVVVLLAATVLFHLANAPVMPLVAQKVKHVGGSNGQVAGVVLVAQAVMIPVALLAGLLNDRWGRKTVFAAGFVVLPIRIALYAFSDDSNELIALQSLDGIGAGIFGVTSVAICGDLTKNRGHFNALLGAIATAVGVGGVFGPFAAGVIVQQFGFSAAFFAFTGVAVIGAALFIGWMPETRPNPAIVLPNQTPIEIPVE